MDSRVKEWVDRLSATPHTPTATNLYRTDSPEGIIRRANLEEYLRRMSILKPSVLIVGEAPGYLGTRRTGVPFGSEFHITGQSDVEFFRDTNGFSLAYKSDRIYKEPTSTVMWRTINKCQELPLLWAAFPLHPHQPGNDNSNRTPSQREVAEQRQQLVDLIDSMNIQTVLALGNVAKETLNALGIAAEKIRHPSRGGATIFATQLQAIIPQK